VNAERIRTRSSRSCAASRRSSRHEPRATVELREQLDLDSMDFLNFAIGLNKAFGVDIPEADYRKLATLEGCVGYLAARTGG